MTYEDLTIHQRIELKGLFQSDLKLFRYRIVWVLWDFRKAIELFLNEDINALTKEEFESQHTEVKK